MSNKKLLVADGQNLGQGLYFIRVKMPLADLDFSKGAAGQIAALHLQAGGKLLLRQALFLPQPCKMAPHPFTVLLVHRHPPFALNQNIFS